MIVILLGIGISSYVFGWGKKGTEVQKPKKTLTGLEIAKQTFTFLDKTIKPEGGFYNFYECSQAFAQICRPKTMYGINHTFSKIPPHFGHLILAYYDYGKKTQDQASIEKVNKAMDFVLSSCEKDIDWCMWHFGPLNVYYNDTKDPRYKNAMLKVADQLLAEKPLIEYMAFNSGLKFRILYEITQDKRYISLLTKQTDAIMAGGLDEDNINPILYKEGDYTVREQLFKEIWSTVLPAYNLTKDQKYLTFAKEALAKSNITKHMGNLPYTDELQHLIYALDSFLQLAKNDPSAKEAHLAKAHEIAQYVYATYADTPQHKLYTSDFGFVNNGLKDSLNNGWLVRHFIKLSDDTFLAN